MIQNINMFTTPAIDTIAVANIWIDAPCDR